MREEIVKDNPSWIRIILEEGETFSGYKAIHRNWTNRGFKFEIGKTYKHEGDIVPCKSGFHFCENAVDCFEYYPFGQCIIVKVRASGKIIKEGTKFCASEITIDDVFELEEIEALFKEEHHNNGKYNSGYRNSGNHNSGSLNSGDYNSGFGNSGSYNSGYRNSGCENSGVRNSGDNNSGYGNSGDFHSGVFCTTPVEKTKLKFFDKQSTWTWDMWVKSEPCWVCEDIFKDDVAISDITEEQWKTLATMPNWNKEKFIVCIEHYRGRGRGG